jgi:hypothetical protein
MGLEDEEDTCDSFPMSLSPHAARMLWSQHGWHTCAAGAAARAVIDGARNRGWDDTDSLVTPQDWVTAYRARHLPTTIGADARVELVADEAITAVSMPHALAAWVHDRIGFQAPTLAPALGQLSTADWAVLAKPELIPAEALEELRRVGVQVLEPGQRLGLPMSSHPDVVRESWWHEWPARHVRYEYLLGVPPMLVLLNHCFWAAKSLHQLARPHKEILFEVLPNSHMTVVLNAEAAAGIRKRASAMSTHKAASQLIAVGARVLEAAGSDKEVLVRDSAGAETVVEIDDALTVSRSGRWPIEYEVYR